MAAGNSLIRLALFGAPVGQSLSPRIHGLFAAQAGLNIQYTARETQPGALADALERFSDEGGSGCNVTLPLKAEALGLAAECTDAAKLARAANTLVALGPEPGWRADNTDGAGLVHDLQTAGLDIADRRVALLGAGGAACGVLGALLASGPARIDIINRSMDKAIDLAERHAGLGPVHVFGAGDNDPGAPAGAGYDLLINATSLGHAGEVPALHAGWFATDGVCYDLNYGSAATPLRDWCAAHGVAYRDGLGMLVEQAAASFQVWTGFAADTGPVLEALQAA